MWVNPQSQIFSELSVFAICGATLPRMPFGLKRYQQSRQSHFVTFSCYGREAHLCDARLCDLFLDCLERTRRKYRFRVYGYVVMPEHVHLLVSEPERETLATAIQALKISVARRAMFYRREPTSAKSGQMWGTIGTVGKFTFWQKRYYDHNVRNYESFVEKLRYMHRNPVTRGLVASPEQWPWSSFRWYWCGGKGPVKINDADILVMTVRPKSA